MPVADLAPELTVLLTAVAALLAAMVLPQRRQGACAWIALAGLALAAALTALQFGPARLTFSGTFALGPVTGAARLTILSATALCVLTAPRWMATDPRHGEFYAMLLFSALGALAVAGAADLMLLLIGVLLSSVTGYVLAAYHRDWAPSLEAGMKYFLIGALANGLMATGVVLVMGMAGTTGYQGLAGNPPAGALGLAGLMLVITGLLFKLGAVPAHAWMPDLAEAAPVPSAAFLTVVPKLAAAVALYRLVALMPGIAPLPLLIGLISAATMTLGNLAALWQDDMRRMLGWSSVSQSGYALMAIAVAGRVETAQGALLFFLAAYAAANIAAFAAIAWLRGRTARADLGGLIQSRPAAALALILAFLSLTGIPPLAGFVGKFGLFEAALAGGMAWLALVAVANSVLSLAYYLRFAAPMVFAAPGDRPETLGAAAWVAMILASILVLVLPLAATLWF